MRKRTWAQLYFWSWYASTAFLIVLAVATAPLTAVWGKWSYAVLITAAILWLRLVKRFFRLRPKGRPGVWTQEMEVERHRSRNMRWHEQYRKERL